MAGIFLCSAMVEHAMRGLTGPEWIAYKQGKERVFGAVMPAAFGGTALVTLAAAILLPLGSGEGVAALLLVGAQAITMIVHLPLNRLLTGWSPAAPPPGWQGARRRWQAWNWARCACAVLAFAVVVAAMAFAAPAQAQSTPLMASTSSTSAPASAPPRASFAAKWKADWRPSTSSTSAVWEARWRPSTSSTSPVATPHRNRGLEFI